MIKKNRQGRVVVFEDESVFPSRQEQKNAASSGADGGSQDGSEVEGSLANESEVEAWYEAAVLRASLDSKTATRAEMMLLQARVAKLDAVAKKAREEAKEQFKSAKHAAEQACRMAVELAEAEYEIVLDCIRVGFHASVEPINTAASETLARRKASLDEVLSKLGQRRADKLATLVEYQASLVKLEKTAAEGQAAKDLGEATT